MMEFAGCGFATGQNMFRRANNYRKKLVAKSIENFYDNGTKFPSYIEVLSHEEIHYKYLFDEFNYLLKKSKIFEIPKPVCEYPRNESLIGR